MHQFSILLLYYHIQMLSKIYIYIYSERERERERETTTCNCVGISGIQQESNGNLRESNGNPTGINRITGIQTQVGNPRESGNPT